MITPDREFVISYNEWTGRTWPLVTSWLSQLVRVTIQSALFTKESSIGCVDIIERKWSCLVHYYILSK